ncbi:MAG: hypothetical protein ACRDTJ_08555, partial [Pseudonocardiaceae bacterium]
LTYAWVDDADACSDAWDIHEFTLTHLPAYVERCAARQGPRLSRPVKDSHPKEASPRIAEVVAGLVGDVAG